MRKILKRWTLLLIAALFSTSAVLAAATSAASSQVKKAPLPSVQKKQTAQVNKSTPIRYVFHEKKRFVNLNDVAKYYSLRFEKTTTGVILYSKDRKITFNNKSRHGSIDGTTVYFLFPLVEQNGSCYISELDFLKIVDTAMKKNSIKKHNLKTIMIDPGHGGSDPGAPGPVLWEKHINLAIAKQLADELRKLNFKVVMTRTSDTFPTLADRSELCAKVKPDLFISIHCNATKDKTKKGVETYLLTAAGASSTSDQQPRDLKYYANDFDKNNFKLAYEIQRALVSTTKEEDKGVRHARFYVLKNASCPAVLVECGYLSNTAEGKSLAKKETQKAVVKGILVGIARYTKSFR